MHCHDAKDAIDFQTKKTNGSDIGRYIGKAIGDYTKCQLLKNPWVPPNDYLFP